MGLSWRYPGEPNHEDFFLFLPRYHRDNTSIGDTASVKSLERDVLKGQASTADVVDLLSEQNNIKASVLSDLNQVLSRTLAPHKGLSIIPTEEALPAELLDSLIELHRIYRSTLNRFNGD